jgi:hypothetical protein
LAKSKRGVHPRQGVGRIAHDASRKRASRIIRALHRPSKDSQRRKETRLSKKPSSSKLSSEKPASNPNAVIIPVYPGEDVHVNAAKIVTGPYVTNAFAIQRFAKGTTGEMLLPNIVTALREASKRVQKNDMADVEAMLTSQAMALNAMFGDLSRRSAANLNDGSYFDAGERYFKMALKAQNQCRMTLETLSAIKNPPVVYAKQANIAHGLQQVNNGTGPPRTEENQNRPNKLLEQNNEISLDAGAPGATGGSNSSMATVDKIDGKPREIF